MKTVAKVLFSMLTIVISPFVGALLGALLSDLIPLGSTFCGQITMMGCEYTITGCTIISVALAIIFTVKRFKS